MSHKYVYLFSEGDETMRELLGGKGANLAQMTRLGMPVPQGFTISTEACTRYYDDGKVIAPEIELRFMNILPRLKRSMKRNSAIPNARFLFPFVQVRALQCPA